MLSQEFSFIANFTGGWEIWRHNAAPDSHSCYVVWNEVDSHGYFSGTYNECLDWVIDEGQGK